MVAGKRSVNLATTTIADDVLVNRNGTTHRMEVARLSAQLGATNGPTRGLRSILYGELNWPDGSVGKVVGDPNEAYRGIYLKLGASGTGSWDWIGPLPEGDAEGLAAGLTSETSARIAADSAEATARINADNAIGNYRVNSAAGGASAIVCTLPSSIAGTATFGTGTRIGFTSPITSTGPVTLEIGGLGVISLRTRSNAECGAGTIVSGRYYEARLSGSSGGVWRLNADDNDGQTLDSLVLFGDLYYIGTDYPNLTRIDPAGRPLLGGGDGEANSDPSVIKLLRTAGSLKIHLPQADGSYVRWTIDHIVDAGRKVDVWQIRGTDEALLMGVSSFAVANICDGGQVEIAVKRVGDSGFTIGGNGHNNDQLLAPPTLLVDGVGMDVSGGMALVTATRVDLYQASQLLDPDDSSHVAKRYTWWSFMDGDLYLSTTLVMDKDLPVRTVYMAMLSLIRSGVTHSGLRSPLYYPVVNLAGDRPAEYGDAAHIMVWGNTYSGEVEVLEGWDRAGRISWVSSSNDRNKIYLSPIGVDGPGTILAAGSSLRMRSRIRVAKVTS